MDINMPWWVIACGFYCLAATVVEMWTARKYGRLLLAAIMHAPLVIYVLWTMK